MSTKLIYLFIFLWATVFQGPTPISDWGNTRDINSSPDELALVLVYIYSGTLQCICNLFNVLLAIYFSIFKCLVVFFVDCPVMNVFFLTFAQTTISKSYYHSPHRHHHQIVQQEPMSKLVGSTQPWHIFQIFTLRFPHDNRQPVV